MTRRALTDVERRALHMLLDEGLDLIDAHMPAAGEAISPGKDQAMRRSLAIFDTIAAAMQPAVDHVFHRELVDFGNPDGHSWECDPFPKHDPSCDHDMDRQRQAFARILTSLPAVLPGGYADALAGSLLALGEADQPPLLRPREGRKQGRAKWHQGAQDAKKRCSLMVWYRAGRQGESIAAATDYYARLTESDIRTVQRWGDHVSNREHDLARAVGRAHREGVPSIDPPRFSALSDQDFLSLHQAFSPAASARR